MFNELMIVGEGSDKDAREGIVLEGSDAATRLGLVPTS